MFPDASINQLKNAEHDFENNFCRKNYEGLE